MPNTIVIVQARLKSTRLPGKVLMEIEGVPILDHVIRRAKASNVGEVFLAYPDSDRELAKRAEDLNVMAVPGPENDVLRRFAMAAELAEPDFVIRITADCPLIDPSIIRELVPEPGDHELDYRFFRGYPRGVGDAELISYEALMTADSDSRSDRDREHVVTYIEEQSRLFRLDIKRAPDNLYRPNYRVCIDEEADLDAIRELHERCQVRPLGAQDIVDTMDQNPDLLTINRHVIQRS